MRRILVTGSSGEIGSALVAALLSDPDVELVMGMDLRPPRRHPPNFNLLQKSITESCTADLRQHAIDTVVHAAYTVEPTYDIAAAHATASAGTRTLVESAIAGGVAAFLHLSSATVYGAHPGNPELLSEGAPVHPNVGFAYAEHKAASEAALRRAAGSHAFESLIILRPSFVVGPGTRNALMRHLARPVVAVPSTQAALQFVHREDLVRTIVGLLRTGLSGTFNVGASGGLTATAMVRRLGRRPLVIRDRLLQSANDLAWRAHLPLAPAPAAALDLLRFPWRVDSTLLKQVLPRAFRYSSEEAFESFAEPVLLSARRRG